LSHGTRLRQSSFRGLAGKTRSRTARHFNPHRAERISLLGGLCHEFPPFFAESRSVGGGERRKRGCRAPKGAFSAFAVAFFVVGTAATCIFSLRWGGALEEMVGILDPAGMGNALEIRGIRDRGPGTAPARAACLRPEGAKTYQPGAERSAAPGAGNRRNPRPARAKQMPNYIREFRALFRLFRAEDAFFRLDTQGVALG
jgi:hypothetical protein